MQKQSAFFKFFFALCFWNLPDLIDFFVYKMWCERSCKFSLRYFGMNLWILGHEIQPLLVTYKNVGNKNLSKSSNISLCQDSNS